MNEKPIVMDVHIKFLEEEIESLKASIKEMGAHHMRQMEGQREEYEKRLGETSTVAAKTVDKLKIKLVESHAREMRLLEGLRACVALYDVEFIENGKWPTIGDFNNIVQKIKPLLNQPAPPLPEPMLKATPSMELQELCEEQAEVLEKVEKCLIEFAWHHSDCDFKNHPNMQDFCQCGYRKHFDEALAALQSLRGKP